MEHNKSLDKDNFFTSKFCLCLFRKIYNDAPNVSATITNGKINNASIKKKNG